jgi:hypothetical protein
MTSREANEEHLVVEQPAISHRIDSVLFNQLPSVATDHFRRQRCCPLSTGGVCGNLNHYMISADSS